MNHMPLASVSTKCWLRFGLIHVLADQTQPNPISLTLALTTTPPTQVYGRYAGRHRGFCGAKFGLKLFAAFLWLRRAQLGKVVRTGQVQTHNHTAINASASSSLFFSYNIIITIMNYLMSINRNITAACR